MILTITAILVLVSFLVCVLAALTPPKANLWIAVLFLTLVEMIRLLPLR
jgi:hypothetical protein